ncbi:hypothetical protein GCM10011430_04980 [Oxalicibacterium solurbis]|uniref:Uncharacterized protein n=1 Tax=Oxalicibacterium solurbis TaxID=69280 RepID=A0A8J3B1W8_9BURK|nr:hypothetical protein GCM10011430_04980 [Oxalicibacterium solurbis]
MFLLSKFEALCKSDARERGLAGSQIESRAFMFTALKHFADFGIC